MKVMICTMIILIRHLKTLTASSLGVSGKSLDASAVTNMVERRSKGIGTTWISNTRIGAGQVASFTVLGGMAVRVHPAIGNFDTYSLLVELISGWANASSSHWIQNESA